MFRFSSTLILVEKGGKMTDSSIFLFSSRKLAIHQGFLYFFDFRKTRQIKNGDLLPWCLDTFASVLPSFA